MPKSSDYSNCLCRLYTQEKEVDQVLILVSDRTRRLQNWSMNFLNLHNVAYYLGQIAKRFACDPAIPG